MLGEGDVYGLGQRVEVTVPVDQRGVVPDVEELDAEGLLAAVRTKADFDAAIIARNDGLPGAQAFIEAFCSPLPRYLGANHADITKLRKERVALTVEQKKAAAEKAAKTRAARHILGKKQRAAIEVA